MKLRNEFYNLLEVEGFSTLRSRLINGLIVLLLLLNISSIVLETDARIFSLYGDYLRAFDLFVVFIFMIEYALRFWASQEGDGRLKFVFSPLAIIDLLTLAPAIFLFLFSVDIRMLRVLRLLRVLKLARHFWTLSLLIKVVHAELKALLAAVSILLILCLIVAYGIYLLEQETQPEAFGSIPKALWWAIVTLTTVGYGDVVPVTIAGKFIGALAIVLGIGIVALPAGILASRFSDELRQREILYKKGVQKILGDGELSEGEHASLKKLQEKLGLDDEQSQEIIESTMKEFVRNRQKPHDKNYCPHCGHPLRNSN